MPDDTEPGTAAPEQQPEAQSPAQQSAPANVPVLTTFQQPQPQPQATPTEQPPAADAPASDPAPATERNAAVDAFLAEIDTRLRHSGHGVSGDVRVRLVFEQPGLIAFDAADVQTALHAASAAMAAGPGGEDGREWTFVGSGPDLDSGRIRAYVRVNPAP